MADAGQTGAQDEAVVPPTEKGAKQEPTPGKAGEDKTIDAQKIHDSAYAEARRTFEAKEAQLREELEALRAQVSEGKSKAKEADDIQAEIEKVKSNFQEQLEKEKGRVGKAAEAYKRAKLIEALEGAGIANPGYHAEVLTRRLAADLDDEGFAVQVLTEKGGKALNRVGDPMTVQEFAAQFASEHPEFVASKSRNGIGYAGAGPAPDKGNIATQIAAAEAAGNWAESKRLKGELLKQKTS